MHGSRRQGGGGEPLVRDIVALFPARRAGVQTFVPWQQVTEVAIPPRGDGWLHEILHPGIRFQVLVRADKTVVARAVAGDALAEHVARALRDVAGNSATFVGTLVAHTLEGHASRVRLDAALSDGLSAPMTFYATDLLHYAGYDLRQVPLLARKRALRRLLLVRADITGLVRFGEHVQGDGTKFSKGARTMGFEGIISRRRDAGYDPAVPSLYTRFGGARFAKSVAG